MSKLFKNEFIDLREILIPENGDIFNKIINQERYGFRLKYISAEDLKKFEAEFEKGKYNAFRMADISSNM